MPSLFSICAPNSRIRRYYSTEAVAVRALSRMVCQAKGINPIREADLAKVTIWEMRRIRIGKTADERVRRFRNAA